MKSRLSAFRIYSRLLCGVLLLFFCHCAAAQREPGEYRTQTISAFGAFVYDHGNYIFDNSTYRSGTEAGGALGFDVTQHFLRFPFAASLEARASLASGTDVSERSYVFGPRLEYRFGRYHPYGDFQLGLGTIHYNPGLHSDNLGDKSALLAGGGGLEIDVLRNVAAKFDVQAQHWDIDPRSRQIFVPTLVTIGVTYTIPFRPFTRQGDPQYR